MRINIKGAMDGIGEFLNSATGVIITLFVALLVIGVVADIATDGSIPVLASIQTLINDTATAVSTWFTSLNSAIGLVFTLVILVVVLFVFAKWLGGKGGKESQNY